MANEDFVYNEIKYNEQKKNQRGLGPVRSHCKRYLEKRRIFAFIDQLSQK